MRRKLPKEYSKRTLMKDNAAMTELIHYYRKILKSQLAANVKLSMDHSKLQKQYDDLTLKTDALEEEELLP